VREGGRKREERKRAGERAGGRAGGRERAEKGTDEGGYSARVARWDPFKYLRGGMLLMRFLLIKLGLDYTMPARGSWHLPR
jgi:hypothetical protein